MVAVPRISATRGPKTLLPDDELLTKIRWVPASNLFVGECLREAVRLMKIRHDVRIAKDTKLRHDHRSQFISHAFPDEVRTLDIESSPSFVRQLDGNGCVERFIRMLKEQLLWLQRLRTVDELNQALHDVARRSNNRWIIACYRTSVAHRRIFLGESA